MTDAEEALVKQQRAHVFYKPEGYDTIVRVLDRLTGRASGLIAGPTPGEGDTLTSLRRHFLAQAQREARWLQRALTTGLDITRARQILHRWTGVGGTLGFVEISQRALDVQRLLDESGGGTADQLRAGVNEIATSA